MPINGKFSHVGPGLGEGGGVWQKASRHWGPAFDMDILTLIAWPVDMLASHHPLYCATKVNISLAWSKHILWPLGSITLCILPPIYAPLLLCLLTLFYWFIDFLFSGEDRVAESDCVCVMLLTQPAATCLLWNTAPHPLHCPSPNPHPPPPCFWTPSIIRWLPHSICFSYLPLTVWKSWKGLMS